MPFAMGYFNWIDDKTRSNPIIDVVVDQINYDSDMAKKYDSSSDLLSEILNALDEKKISWPKDFRQMSSKEWIGKLRIDPIFYFHHTAGSSDKMQEYEKLLIKLVADFLGRTLVLVPLLEEDSELSFTPLLTTEQTKKYYIACCNELYIYNFFLSVLQIPKSDSPFQKQTSTVENHLDEETNFSCFSFCWKKKRSDL